jgi:lysophospholipase L1-like esterase
MRQNYIERNPKKILIASILILLLLVIMIAEYSLKTAYPEKVVNYGSQERYIRLRERNPEFHAYVYPARNEMQYIDGLDSGNKLLRTDRNGFIMPSNIHKDPDINIVFLGGSTTEGEFVDENNRFPYVVGRTIEEKTGLKVNSFNSGMYGNNTLHTINILLNKIVPMKPDIAIMMHNINDLSILMHEQTHWNSNSTRSPIATINYYSGALRKIKNATIPNLSRELKFHINSVFSSNLSLDEFHNTRDIKLIVSPDKIIEQFERNLRLFVSICKIYNITPILMTQFNRFSEEPDKVVLDSIRQPLKKFGMTYEEYRALYNALNASIINIASNNKILVIDLEGKTPKTNKYMYDSIHLNNVGSLHVTKVISDELLKLDILRIK